MYNIPVDHTIHHNTLPLHQTDIWGLTKSMLQKQIVLIVKSIPCLVKQNVGLVPESDIADSSPRTRRWRPPPSYYQIIISSEDASYSKPLQEEEKAPLLSRLIITTPLFVCLEHLVALVRHRNFNNHTSADEESLQTEHYNRAKKIIPPPTLFYIIDHPLDLLLHVPCLEFPH